MISDTLRRRTVSPIFSPCYPTPKHGYSRRWNFIASMTKSWDIRHLSTSGRAAILAIWWVLHLFSPHHLVALPYLGNVTKAFPLTPSRYEMAAKIVAWGNFSPSPPYAIYEIWSNAPESALLAPPNLSRPTCPQTVPACLVTSLTSFKRQIKFIDLCQLFGCQYYVVLCWKQVH